MIVGVFNGEGPPVPIPNTEVKLTSADNTCLETDREDRSMPTQNRYFGSGSFLLCCTISCRLLECNQMIYVDGEYLCCRLGFIKRKAHISELRYKEGKMIPYKYATLVYRDGGGRFAMLSSDGGDNAYALQLYLEAHGIQWSALKLLKRHPTGCLFSCKLLYFFLIQRGMASPRFNGRYIIQYSIIGAPEIQKKISNSFSGFFTAKLTEGMERTVATTVSTS